MKTSYIASKTGSFPFLIMAVIFILFTLGCEEADYIINTRGLNFDTQESNINSPWHDTTFVVDPSGTHIIALDGKVELGFFEEAVLLPTEFSISSWPTTDMDTSLYLQTWGLQLDGSSEECTFCTKVGLWMTYDQFQLPKAAMLKEDNLTIYCYSDTGFVSIGNCSKNFLNQKISGYIDGCGYYVVGGK
jgi:hypothetical protein